MSFAAITLSVALAWLLAALPSRLSAGLTLATAVALRAPAGMVFTVHRQVEVAPAASVGSGQFSVPAAFPVQPASEPSASVYWSRASNVVWKLAPVTGS